MIAKRDNMLVIDLGTSKVRCAVVSVDGMIVEYALVPQEHFLPRTGWFEQSPDAWWKKTTEAVRRVLASPEVDSARLAGLCVCGHMHSPVPLDREGELVLERVQLWSDKRCADMASAFGGDLSVAEAQGRTGNPPTPGWLGFKLAWMRENQPRAYSRTAVILTAKDFINYRLTGALTTDYSEASGSFLLNQATLTYDPAMAGALGLDISLLPPIRESSDVIGEVSASASSETGLPRGLPVVAGGGDFPVAMLGAGALRPKTGADITGTSTVLSSFGAAPVLDARVCNLRTPIAGWASFTTLEAGGASLHWLWKLLDDQQRSLDEINDLAEQIPPGSDQLLFLPYLHGERMGRQANSRAQFFGASNRHGKGHFYRAAIEGTAFAARQNLELMRQAGIEFDYIIASGGGARSRLWLNIKANIYGIPIVVPQNLETGIVGGAVLAGIGTGVYRDIDRAINRLVHSGPPVLPDPALSEYYHHLYEVFVRLYRIGGPLCAELDALANLGQEKSFQESPSAGTGGINQRSSE